MNNIFLGGIQGVGKSTIIKEIKKKKSNVGNFSFGECLRNTARKKYPDYTKFHLLSNEKRQEVIKIVKEDLKKICDSQLFGSMLFDNHYTIFHNGQIQNTFPDENIIFYNKLILVSLPVEILVNRILTDNKERTSVIGKSNMIIKHAKEEKERARFLSSKYGFSLLEVENLDLSDTVDKILDFIN